MDEMTIHRRFRGPPNTGNGGYTAGLLATAHRAGAVPTAVTLRHPPPLDRAMRLVRTDDSTRLVDGDLLVAEVRDAELTSDPVEAVSPDDAREAQATYAGLNAHPFPGCFTCGPDREVGDGLRLFPGRIGGERTACLWTPDASLMSADEPGRVAPEFVWAALDCPGGWTADLIGRPMVLGRITGHLDAPVGVGEPHVVMGRMLGQDGRKTFTTTALYDSDGQVVARAEHVWFAIDPSRF